MNESSWQLSPGLRKVRRTARAGSLVSVGVILAWFIGEALGKRGGSFQDLTSGDAVLLLCCPAGVVVGMVVGWWQELRGGLITAASLAVQYAGFYLFDGRLPAVWWVFLLFAAPGLLFLVAALLSRHDPRQIA